MNMMNRKHPYYNIDCVVGCRKYIEDNSVDLIVTDPPYGIDGDKLHRHYNRKEEFVVDGYVEVPRAEYAEFSRRWIAEAERILRPGGSIYIVSGYTNLNDILNALCESNLVERNHIIWKYNFGVHTRKKWVSSHYHVLYYVKPGGAVTFNANCRFGPDERDGRGGSLNYQDREDVWDIKREYKPGRKKNKNELPAELLKKIILYSSNEDDLVCDLFLGSFSTAKIALGLGRRATGFEVSATAYRHQMNEMKKVKPGALLKNLRQPVDTSAVNQNKPWTPEERSRLAKRFRALEKKHPTKKKRIEILCEEFGRGRFAILNAINHEIKNEE
jgi:site-specific DNA-methyltransferase (adenine-specific)